MTVPAAAGTMAWVQAVMVDGVAMVDFVRPRQRGRLRDGEFLPATLAAHGSADVYRTPGGSVHHLDPVRCPALSTVRANLSREDEPFVDMRDHLFCEEVRTDRLVSARMGALCRKCTWYAAVSYFLTTGDGPRAAVTFAASPPPSSSKAGVTYSSETSDARMRALAREHSCEHMSTCAGVALVANVSAHHVARLGSITLLFELPEGVDSATVAVAWSLLASRPFHTFGLLTSEDFAEHLYQAELVLA